MPFRQISVVLLALIAILLAALIVLSWDGDDDTDASGTTTTTDDAASTSTTSTTTLAPVATSIPVDCGTDPTTGESTTTTTESTTTTTTEAPADGDTPDTDVPAATRPTLGPNSSLSTVGLDTVTFGLTVSQAEDASGHSMVNCEPVSECYRVTPVGAPEGISFVVDAGTIERVDIVGDSPITTVSGAGIGTTEDELDSLFGDRLERVERDDGRTEILFVPSDENDQEFRVVFTLVDGAVESLRSGRVPLILGAAACV